MKKINMKIMSLAAVILLMAGSGAVLLGGIGDAEASDVTEITIAPGMRYTYTPTFPDDLNPTVTIHSQGVGASGTGGTWGSVTGKTLTVNVPLNATAGSTYQVTLRATTTDPTQTLDIPILFNIAAKMSVSGSQANIVEGTSINFTPTVTGMTESGFTWTVTSGKTLPDGLTLNSSTGKVTGVPSGKGTKTIYLTATSSYGESANLVVTFEIVSKLIATNTPTNGMIVYA